MNFDIQFAINTCYPASIAAYQCMTVPAASLVMPPEYVYLGTIQASALCASRISVVNSSLAESLNFGVVLWNAAESTVLVAFRGTQTVWDWLADLDAAPVGFMHAGFELIYSLIRESVVRLLTGCVGVKKVVVTGHSLGGAVAVLAALDIVETVLPKVPMCVVTFAGPRALCPALASKFNRLIDVCYRVVNFMDIVPQVPLPPIYEHVGQEVLVRGGFKPLRAAFAHSLTQYLAGLKFLLTPSSS